MKHRIKLMSMLICVVAFVGFSSCTIENEDIASSGNDFSIFGKWRVTAFHDYYLVDVGGNNFVGDEWKFSNECAWIQDHGDTVYKFYSNNQERGGYLFWKDESTLIDGESPYYLTLYAKLEPGNDFIYEEQYWCFRHTGSELELKERNGTRLERDFISVKLNKLFQ